MYKHDIPESPGAVHPSPRTHESAEWANIPAELKARPQWVVWKYRKVPGANKPRKIPINPVTKRQAKPNDPSTWGSFEAAVGPLGQYDGLGYMFAKDDPYVGYDFDGVRDPETGAIQPWAEEILKKADSYSEVSPSGTGIHCIIRAKKTGTRCTLKGALPGFRPKGADIEVYEHSRYFTMTGIPVNGFPTEIADRQSQLEELEALIDQSKKSPDRQAERTSEPASTKPVRDLDNDALLDWIRASKQGEKFEKLWDGNIEGYGSRSEADAALLSILRWWTGGDKDWSLELFSKSGLYREKWDREDYRERTWEVVNHGEVRKIDRRPDHLILAGELPSDVDALQKAILESNEDIFQRSGMLVRLIRTDRPPKKSDKVQRPENSPLIESVPPESLIELAEKLVGWKRLGSSGPVACNVPPRVPKALLARGSWPFRHLEGISECPILRPNGTIAQQPGYDEETGFFLALPGSFPSIPDRPSEDDVAKSVAIIKVPLSQFPFVCPQHLSAAIAALLTPFARAAVNDLLPVFAFSAPTSRTGKTLLSDVISTTATGREAPKALPGRDMTEDRKMVLASALAGDPIILFDNIPPGEPFGSGALAGAITAGMVYDRILGKSERKAVPFRPLILVTGNNLQLIADLQGRTIPILLDARCERPEERNDFVEERRGKDRLLSWVRHNRPQLVCAALTILRAYVVAGCPSQGRSEFGGFDAWNRLVRGALVWAGETDPLEGRRETVSSADPERENHDVLLRVLRKHLGIRDFTMKEIADYILRNPADDLISSCNDVSLKPSRDDFSINAKSLGQYLRTKVDWPVNGLVLRRKRDTHTGLQIYSVETCS